MTRSTQLPGCLAIFALLLGCQPIWVCKDESGCLATPDGAPGRDDLGGGSADLSAGPLPPLPPVAFAPVPLVNTVGARPAGGLKNGPPGFLLQVGEVLTPWLFTGPSAVMSTTPPFGSAGLTAALAADLDKDGNNEILLTKNGEFHRYEFDAGYQDFLEFKFKNKKKEDVKLRGFFANADVLVGIGIDENLYTYSQGEKWYGGGIPTNRVQAIVDVPPVSIEPVISLASGLFPMEQQQSVVALYWSSLKELRASQQYAPKEIGRLASSPHRALAARRLRGSTDDVLLAEWPTDAPAALILHAWTATRELQPAMTLPIPHSPLVSTIGFGTGNGKDRVDVYVAQRRSPREEYSLWRLILIQTPASGVTLSVERVVDQSAPPRDVTFTSPPHTIISEDLNRDSNPDLLVFSDAGCTLLIGTRPIP